MARIMKVRTIPRGYVTADGLKSFVRDKNSNSVSEWFMALYEKYGNPQEGGMWSYLLRHNTIVLKVVAVDADTIEFSVWVSPAVVLAAKRKKTKVINTIARRLNEQKVVFKIDGEENLYYPIRRKNAELKERYNLSDKAIDEAMKKAMTEEESIAVYGDISQYMDIAREEIVNTINEIFSHEE